MNSKNDQPLSKDNASDEDILRIADELNVEVETLENRLEMADLGSGILACCAINEGCKLF